MTKPTVFIQIVTFNSVDTIAPCIRAAIRQEGFVLGDNLFVSIYDNSSEDGTRNEVLSQFRDQVQLKMNSQNLGFATAHNQGFGRALESGADYVLVLNPDLALAPTCLQTLVRTLECDSRAGAACPKLLRADSALQPLNPSIVDAAGMFMTPEIRHLDRGGGEPDSPVFESPGYVFGASGACALYRRECLLDAALPQTEVLAGDKEDPSPEKHLPFFDDEFFAYREDADVSWRLLWLGWKTRFEPSAVGYHVRRVVPERRGSLPAEINSWSVRNRFLLQVNNLSLRAHGAFLVPAFFRNAMVVFAVLIREHQSIPGLRQALSLFPRAYGRRRELFRRRRESMLGMKRWFASKPIVQPALAAFPDRTASESPKFIQSVHGAVISYGTKDHATICIESLLRDSESLPFQLTLSIIDNSPEGSTQAFDISPSPKVELRRHPENLGFAGAVNAALFGSDCDALLILNPDIRLSSESLVHLVESLNRFQGLGAVSPVLINPDGSRQHGFTTRRFPSLISTLVELALLHRIWPKNPWSAHYRQDDDPWVKAYIEGVPPVPALPAEQPDRPLIVEQPAGACLLLRASTARDLGGFDASFYPAWFEDVDFCKRLVQNGSSAAVTAGATAEHIGGVTKERLSPEAFARYWYRNLLRYWRKHGSTFEFAALRVLVPLALLGRGIAYALLALFSRLTSRGGKVEMESARAFIRLSLELLRS